MSALYEIISVHVSFLFTLPGMNLCSCTYVYEKLILNFDMIRIYLFTNALILICFLLNFMSSVPGKIFCFVLSFLLMLGGFMSL